MSHYALSITYHFGRFFFFMQKWRNFLIDKKVLDSDKKIISGKYEPAALQFFIGDQLFHRNPCFVKTVC